MTAPLNACIWAKHYKLLLVATRPVLRDSQHPAIPFTDRPHLSWHRQEADIVSLRLLLEVVRPLCMPADQDTGGMMLMYVQVGAAAAAGMQGTSRPVLLQAASLRCMRAAAKTFGLHFQQLQACP